MKYLKVLKSFQEGSSEVSFEFEKGEYYPIDSMAEDLITVKVEDPEDQFGGKVNVSVSDESNFEIVDEPEE
ncbi:hypothetical protein JOC78_001581 [Bacillus ectoiniformans]|uniref:hypothetical protein n=1 Tax=Bacillus ectoiniformans TaxID=1494429 RepID=UPI00195DF466|nr:hypothetical protein [Bacillus ectoiniformans]MBM7648635.1 hypothetical protein [Bacillus ectoiniformans]